MMIEESKVQLLRNLSPQAFLSLGIQQIAYIRPFTVDGSSRFAIHAADGTPLVIHEDESMAKAVSRQNDLEPFTLQ